MHWIRKISAQTRLSIVFAVLTLMAALFAGITLLNAVTYQRQLTDLKTKQLDQQRRSTAAYSVLYEQLSVRSIVLDPDYAEQYLGDILRFRESFNDFINFEMLSDDPDIVSQIDEIAGLRTNFDQEVDKIIGMARDGSDSASILDEIDSNQNENELDLLSDIQVMERESRADIQSAMQNMQNTTKSIGLWGSLALMALGLILVVGVATANDIFQPLQALSNAIHQFEANDFTPRLLQNYTTRTDELGEITRSFSGMATSMIKSNQLKEQFLESASRFIPTQYLDFLEKDDITSVKLGDNVAAEMAVMFSDIRGFTTLSEKMTPQQNFDFVNEYLRQVSPLIQAHEGFIVKFLGDGMMAIFPYGVEDAVQAGIDKQKMVKTFNAEIAQRGLPPISVGIGIHTGDMMVGMIGEEARLQGDAFSDNVNLTSRVEGLNKFFGTSMIITEETLALLKNPERFKLRFLGKIIVKGRNAPLALYEVYQGLSDEIIALREATRTNFERGLALYTQGQLSAAAEAFWAVLATDPNDKTAQFYLDSCLQLGHQALPAGWNGSIVMDSK